MVDGDDAAFRDIVVLGRVNAFVDDARLDFAVSHAAVVDGREIVLMDGARVAKGKVGMTAEKDDLGIALERFGQHVGPPSSFAFASAVDGVFGWHVGENENGLARIAGCGGLEIFGQRLDLFRGVIVPSATIHACSDERVPFDVQQAMIRLLEHEVVLLRMVRIVVVVAHHDVDGQMGGHDGCVAKDFLKLLVLLGQSPVGDVAANEDSVGVGLVGEQVAQGFWDFYHRAFSLMVAEVGV